jgi:hypothetical protein
LPGWDCSDWLLCRRFLRYAGRCADASDEKKRRKMASKHELSFQGKRIRGVQTVCA